MNLPTESKPQRKTAQATESLRQLVEQIGPDAKLPTYLELLSSLSVSRTTLNAALDELESQRVIYRRHGVGIFTAARRQAHNVALLCNPSYFQGKTHSPFWDVLLEGARERALTDDLSCEIHFCKTRDPHTLPFSDNLLNSLQLMHLQGVMGVGMNYAAYRWLKEKGIHYVSFGGPGSWHIAIDTTSLIRQGVQALADQGCRRIALLAPVAPHREFSLLQEVWKTKIEVFRMALAHHNLPFERKGSLMNLDWIADSTGMTSLSHREQGYRAVHRVLAEAGNKAPDGLLFTDDVMAMGGMAALRGLGLQLGRDVQVATHANRGTTVLSPYENLLTRLEVDPAEIVDGLFSTLYDLLEGRQPVGYHANTYGSEMDKRIQPVLLRPEERNY